MAHARVESIGKGRTRVVVHIGRADHSLTFEDARELAREIDAAVGDDAFTAPTPEAPEVTAAVTCGETILENLRLQAECERLRESLDETVGMLRANRLVLGEYEGPVHVAAVIDAARDLHAIAEALEAIAAEADAD